MYRILDPDKTLRTIEKLNQRIDERFSGSGLVDVCKDLVAIANDCKHKSEWIDRPNIALRIITALIILLSLAALVYSVLIINFSIKEFDLGELIQVIEAGFNNIVLIGAAIFFLITLETRVKRARALHALHELRVMAHVIDMHQLTKDPSRILSTVIMTPSSPKQSMTSYELTRYLDYCSEMLSLTGKVAALYAQNFRDPVVLGNVNEIETLTTSLSRKIWQKIMIIHQVDHGHLTESQ